MSMLDYNGGTPGNDLVVLLLLDLLLYVICAYAVLEGEIAAFVIVCLLATAVLIVVGYHAMRYFKRSEGIK